MPEQQDVLKQKKIPEQKDNKSVIESLFNFFGI